MLELHNLDMPMLFCKRRSTDARSCSVLLHLQRGRVGMLDGDGLIHADVRAYFPRGNMGCRRPADEGGMPGCWRLLLPFVVRRRWA